RIERHDRLARPDVSLEEPLHGRGAREIDVDLADRLLLVRRERERKRGAVARDQLAGLAERRCQRPLARRCAARYPELEQKELVESQPAPPGLGLVFGLWVMQRGDRVTLQREPLARPQSRRKGIVIVARERERGGDER